MLKGDEILCGYFKDFDDCLSVEQKEKVTAAVETMNYREEMCECGEDY